MTATAIVNPTDTTKKWLTYDVISNYEKKFKNRGVGRAPVAQMGFKG